MTFKKILAPVLMVLCLQALAMQAFAAEESYYDGKDNLLCSVMTTRQCELDGCRHVDIEDLGVPRHLLTDFKKKRITSPSFSGLHAETRIGSMSQKDNRLFLHGVDENAEALEDALSWTMVIADPTGMMTLTIAAEEVAFVGFGACVPVE